MKNLSSQHGGTLLGLALGLLVGVLVSLGVVLFLNKTPLPFIDKVIQPEPRENANGAKPLPLPGKPGDKPIERVDDKTAGDNKANGRKFEFYDILEGKKQATPAAAPPEKAAPAAKTEAVPTSGIYLQVGAFQKKGDADNLRAKLAMLGFETEVLEVEVPEKGMMHRVRVGPYRNPEEMNRARTQLSQQGVPAAVVRNKN